MVLKELPIAAFLRPSGLGKRVRENPVWVGLGVSLILLWAATVVLGHHALLRETLSRLPASATAADRTQVREWLDADLPRTLLILPFRALAGWLVTALLLAAICRLLFGAGGITYRSMLSLEVHASAATVAGTALGTLLAPVAPDAAFLLAGSVLLKSVNIGTLWYLVILFGGVRVLCSAGPVKAALAVLLVWGSSLAFHILVLTLVGDSMGL